MSLISKKLSRSATLVETPLPFPDAGAMPGATILGEDGRVYTSVRYPNENDPYEWRSVVVLAEDVAADVVRVLTGPISVTVHQTNPAANYTTLSAALDALSRYQPPSGLGEAVLGTVTLLDGFIANEQIISRGTNLGWVQILSETYDSIPVMQEALTVIATTGTNYPFMEFIGSTPPLLGCHFVAAGTPVPGRTYYGMIVRGGFLGTILTNPNPDPDNLRRDGLSGFTINITGRQGGYFRFGANAKFTDALGTNIEARDGSYASIAGGDYSGAVGRGILVDGSGASIAGGANFRRSVGVDSTSDIMVASGAVVGLSSTVLGGIMQPANIWSSSGLINDGRVTSVTDTRGSNSNGAYDRDRGWQTCVKTNLSAVECTIAQGSGFRSNNVTWTFPAAFDATVLPAVAINAIGAGIAGVEIITLTNTAVTFRVKSLLSIATAITIIASATGRGVIV